MNATRRGFLATLVTLIAAPRSLLSAQKGEVSSRTMPLQPEPATNFCLAPVQLNGSGVWAEFPAVKPLPYSAPVFMGTDGLVRDAKSRGPNDKFIGFSMGDRKIMDLIPVAYVNARS